MITLCPTTWEKAAKMKNFSGWVREQIKELMDREHNWQRNQPEYWAYCEKCDLSASGPNKIAIEYKYCPKCHDKMDYRGMLE